MSEIDYNYHNTPELIGKVLEEIGGISAVLSFCQTNHVEVFMGSDLSYNAWINGRGGGCWSCELDAFSSLVMGIADYQKRKDE